MSENDIHHSLRSWENFGDEYSFVYAKFNQIISMLILKLDVSVVVAAAVTVVVVVVAVHSVCRGNNQSKAASAKVPLIRNLSFTKGILWLQRSSCSNFWHLWTQSGVSSCLVRIKYSEQISSGSFCSHFTTFKETFSLDLDCNSGI